MRADARADLQPVRFRLLEPQVQLVRSPATYTLYSGGFGAGKSFGLTVRQLQMSARFPSVPHGLAGPNMKMLKRDVKPIMRRILREREIEFEEFLSEPSWIRPEWCTTEDSGIWFASCHDPNDIKGPNWATVGINEPGLIKRAAWDNLLARTRVPLLECSACGAWRGDELELLGQGDWQPEARETHDTGIPCLSCGATAVTVQPNYASLAGTPEGFNWLYDEFIDESQHPERDWSDWRRIYADTAVNVFIPKTYRARLLETFDAQLAEEKLRGQYVNVRKGRMYYAFDRTTHVQSGADYAPALPLHFGWDFNVAPLCTEVAQQRKGGGIWFVDELVAPDDGKTREVMHAFCDRYGKHRAGIRIHGDRSGRSRDTRSAGLTTDYDVIAQIAKERGLHDFSITVADSNPPVIDRVARVNGALRSAEATPRPRMWINPRCRRLIKDLEQQAWKPGTTTPDDGDGTLGHCADAAGYVVWSLVKLPSWRAGGVRVGHV